MYGYIHDEGECTVMHTGHIIQLATILATMTTTICDDGIHQQHHCLWRTWHGQVDQYRAITYSFFIMFMHPPGFRYTFYIDPSCHVKIGIGSCFISKANIIYRFAFIYMLRLDMKRLTATSQSGRYTFHVQGQDISNKSTILTDIRIIIHAKALFVSLVSPRWTIQIYSQTSFISHTKKEHN